MNSLLVAIFIWCLALSTTHSFRIHEEEPGLGFGNENLGNPMSATFRFQKRSAGQEVDNNIAPYEYVQVIDYMLGWTLLYFQSFRAFTS